MGEMKEPRIAFIGFRTKVDIVMEM